VPYLGANIDRAIVMTQYDLRGFSHPAFGRLEKMDPKSLFQLTGNLVAFAAMSDDRVPTDGSYATYRSDASFEERLNMCQLLAVYCEDSRRAAIQLIVKEIIAQSKTMKAEVAAGTREATGYLQPLDKSNCWGMTVLALAEAFGVVIDSEESVPV